MDTHRIVLRYVGLINNRTYLVVSIGVLSASHSICYDAERHTAASREIRRRLDVKQSPTSACVGYVMPNSQSVVAAAAATEAT